MKIEVYKNQYGYNRAKCPFCSDEAYMDRAPAHDKLRYLKRHFINQAKNEALDLALDKKSLTPHLDYVKTHVKKIAPRISTSLYEFNDTDLKKGKE